MKFLIVTHVHHKEKDNQYFGYAPYVREMNIWLKFVDEVVLVAPLRDGEITAINIAYRQDKMDFRAVPDFSFTSFKNMVSALGKMPILFWKIFWAMKEADHIHLRCPGNMGLLGCWVQIFFPHKKKTTKYAGNWDPKSKQPWTYRLQKWILSNTFLTRNMQVLVYGEWPNQTKNIVPFFTASYSETEIKPIKNGSDTNVKYDNDTMHDPRHFECFEVTKWNQNVSRSGVKSNGSAIAASRTTNDQRPTINFLFVGTLSVGKNPLYAVQLVAQLHQLGYAVQLEVYGEGKLRADLENYIQTKRLSEVVFLHGNQSAEIVKQAYQNSHFVILASKSEGWPKVLAEGMFWGCVPLATPVSCVTYILGEGERGVLLQSDITTDVQRIQTLLDNPTLYNQKKQKAVLWSRQFTLEKFENGIAIILHGKS